MSLFIGAILWLENFFACTYSNAAQNHVPPIIAIGDIHADLSSAKKAFALAKVTDDQGNWILKNGIVVQTGDLTDRGPDGEPLLEWIRKLEEEAPKFNSQFVVLLGNHESMNLMGDWRYVSQEDVNSFGGMAQRQEAFSIVDQGEWAEWLLKHNSVVQIQDNIFVHGGVSELFNRPAPDLSQETIQALLGRGDRQILGDTGPLWYRGYWLNDESVACMEAQKVLVKLGAKRMIMGHTTQRDGKIRTRCDGRLIAIDTGISRHYGEHTSALEIIGDQIYALYPSERVLIVGNEE